MEKDYIRAYPGTDLPIRSDAADVAELLLDLVPDNGGRVLREKLRFEWAAIALDIKREQGAAAIGRGHPASHVLKGCLVSLERLGAAQREGDCVIVLDRGVLQSVIDLWDSDQRPGEAAANSSGNERTTK